MTRRFEAIRTEIPESVAKNMAIETTGNMAEGRYSICYSEIRSETSDPDDVTEFVMAQYGSQLKALRGHIKAVNCVLQKGSLEGFDDPDALSVD